MSVCLCSFFLELDAVLELLFDDLHLIFGFFPLLDEFLLHLLVLSDSVLMHVRIGLLVAELCEENSLASVGVDFISSHCQEIVDFVSKSAGTSNDLKYVVLV